MGPPPAEPPEPLPKIPCPERAPDLVVVLTNTDEACQQRCTEEMGVSEKEFKARMEKWKKENPEEGPSFADFIRERFQQEPVIIDMQETSLDVAENQIVSELEAKRPIFNFMLPPQVETPQEEDATGDDNKKSAQDEEKLRREAE